MKVNTSLKSGNLVDDAAHWINQGASAVGNLFTTAEHQARSFTGVVSNAAHSAYNTVRNWFAGR